MMDTIGTIAGSIVQALSMATMTVNTVSNGNPHAAVTDTVIDIGHDPVQSVECIQIAKKRKHGGDDDDHDNESRPKKLAIDNSGSDVAAARNTVSLANASMDLAFAKMVGSLKSIQSDLGVERDKNCLLQFCTVKVQNLLRILEFVQVTVDFAYFSFTSSGLEMHESSEQNVAQIHLSLKKSFFEEYNIFIDATACNNVNNDNKEICGGYYNTSELYTNVGILKKLHHVEAIVFDVSSDRVLTHGISRRGEYVQTGPILTVDSRKCPDNNNDRLTISSFRLSTPEMHLASEQLRAHCQSAFSKGCKHVKLSYESGGGKIIFADADQLFSQNVVVTQDGNNQSSSEMNARCCYRSMLTLLSTSTNPDDPSILTKEYSNADGGIGNNNHNNNSNIFPMSFLQPIAKIYKLCPVVAMRLGLKSDGSPVLIIEYKIPCLSNEQEHVFSRNKSIINDNSNQLELHNVIVKEKYAILDLAHCRHPRGKQQRPTLILILCLFHF